MLIYWLLFAFPAVMSLVYPADNRPGQVSPTQHAALLAFVWLYTIVAALRFETGGDWLTYQEMFDDIQYDTLGFALGRTDPLFGLLNWISSWMGGGVYIVNGVSAFVLALGTIRSASMFRDPWLAVVIAVPYLLIVVGMGYVRQGAAIGMVLLAIAALDRGRPIRTVIFLLIGAGLHSSAALMLPIFGYAMASRRRVLAIALALVGAMLFVFILAPKADNLEYGYIDQEYDSGGALVRVMMNVAPTLLLVARWRHFRANPKPRAVWLAVAVSNLLLLLALILSPSSTAVDRVGLYFAIVQLAAFGEIVDLLSASRRSQLLVRILGIALAALVQVIWLVFATHSMFWVPYQSVFSD